jgi:hypothetical protein
MTEADWARLLDLIESRRSQFEDLLSRATTMVEKFFLCPASTPAVEFDTFPVQLSMTDVSLSTSGLSTRISDQHQAKTTTLGVERAHKTSTLPLEDDGLEEPPSRLCSQSRTEVSKSPVSNSQPVDPDSPNGEQYGSALTLGVSIHHNDFLDSPGARRDIGNPALPTPDWSSGFDFPTQ